MIAGMFHEGSGTGNQLARYVATRTLALDKGYEFGMVNPELFKGYSFMNLDMGILVTERPVTTWTEKRVDHPNGTDIRPYDASWEQIEDSTLVDGELQDMRYFSHRLDEIRQWLAVEPMDCQPNECVLGFRGGEYTYFPELYLTEKYWRDAMAHMRSIRPDMTFRIVTDDPESAHKMLPELPISHEIGSDWRSIRYAPYLILSNSSFYILPALLNQNVQEVVAPKYWARHNVSDGYWALEQNATYPWKYLNREGNFS